MQRILLDAIRNRSTIYIDPQRELYYDIGRMFLPRHMYNEHINKENDEKIKKFIRVNMIRFKKHSEFSKDIHNYIAITKNICRWIHNNYNKCNTYEYKRKFAHLRGHDNDFPQYRNGLLGRTVDILGIQPPC